MLDWFMTSTNFDWQWAEIIRGARAINMERLPAEVEPVVWAIDDWNRNYKLGLVFEGRDWSRSTALSLRSMSPMTATLIRFCINCAGRCSST